MNKAGSPVSPSDPLLTPSEKGANASVCSEHSRWDDRHARTEATTYQAKIRSRRSELRSRTERGGRRQKWGS